MAVTLAKKSVAVAVPAKPVVAGPVAKPVLAAVPPVAEPAVDPAATVDDDAADDDAATAKEPRRTRKDFATHEEFCDYKIGLATANVAKWQERIALWTEKRANKDADVKVKKMKKAEKLIAAFIQIQRDLGMPEDKIAKMADSFKSNLAEAAE